MNNDAAPPTSPPTPAAQCIEGASFSPVLKALASCGVVTLAWWSWQVLQAGAWAQWTGPARVFMVLALGVIAAGWWGILTSRTSIDGVAIRQSWLWPKRVELATITRLKLIRVPGLDWLIAPRLVVRADGLMLTTFHAADPRVLAAFKQLAYG
jgi:hypothetical protein